MKLLIIEDEKKTGTYLRKGLSEAGYLVNLACDGVDGLYQATSQRYDLIVLDVMLPHLNGWQVLRALRSNQVDTPVILLTARDQVEDRVKGLELGADDYIVKPFAFVELFCWRAFAPCSNASNQQPKARLSFPSPISIWTCCDAKCFATKNPLPSPPKSLPCWSCLCAKRGK